MNRHIVYVRNSVKSKNFKGDHFHLISSEIRNTVQYFPIHIMLKMHVWKLKILTFRNSNFKTWFKPSSKKISDRSKVVLLSWIFYVFYVLCVYAFVCVCLYVPCGHLLGKGWPLGSLFVVSNYEFVTFPLVSWVRCGTWLYRFLIFAPLLTLQDVYKNG